MVLPQIKIGSPVAPSVKDDIEQSHRGPAHFRESMGREREREREVPKRCAREKEGERGRKKEKGSDSQLIPMHVRVTIHFLLDPYRGSLLHLLDTL